MADLVQDLGGSDEAGDVEVVTARVHDTGHGPEAHGSVTSSETGKPSMSPRSRDDRALCQIWPTLAAQGPPRPRSGRRRG